MKTIQTSKDHIPLKLSLYPWKPEKKNRLNFISSYLQTCRTDELAIIQKKNIECYWNCDDDSQEMRPHKKKTETLTLIC